jgi:tyrosine ammonia-lyase
MYIEHGQNDRDDAIFVMDGPLSIADFVAIASGRRRLALSERVSAGIAAAQARMARCIRENRLVYGVTTGFGPLANAWIDGTHVEELQTNLIYHLATGVGAPLSWIEARGLMLSRLISMAQGHSGASNALVSLMIACLNAGLAPVVPEKGTVGASGDLTPSAHMALALMGEGAFLTRDGATRDSAEVLREIGLQPHRLAHRDGLALVNGTSAMTAIATLNQSRAERAAGWAFRLTAAHAEILRGKAEAWAPAFGAFRPHRGQIEAHLRLNRLIEGSRRVDRQRAASLRLQSADFDAEGIQRHEIAHQDPYTIRCAPQILGAVLDVLRFHQEIVTVEINSATDNPLFDTDEPFALHGGNFYGQHIAFAADALSPAVVKLGILSERQLARLVDPAMNHGLPAFLQPYKTGLHSGFMGCQVTASALVAELRSQAIPASIQSIPTNANNQDVVSMGTIAARKCRNALDDLFRILAIQAMACAQAVDLETRDGEAGFSPEALSLRDFVRRSSRFLHQDRPLGGEIETLASRMASLFEEEFLQ